MAFKKLKDSNMVDELWTRRVRRWFVGLVTSQNKRVNLLAQLFGQIYDLATGEEFGNYCEVMVVGSYMAVIDSREAEDVMALVGLDVLGKQAVLIADEVHDEVGISRAIKKVLDSKGYHVYYQNVPMRYRDGILAVGPNSIAKTNRVQKPKAAASVTTTEGNQHVWKH